MSKVLIHSIAFSPDGVSTAYLYNDIALRLKDAGYEVVVLTTTPHYNALESELEKQPLKRKCLGTYQISYYHGIVVKHVYQKKFKNSLLRIIGFLYWHFMSFMLGLFEKKIDVILSPSPPLSIGIINCFLGRLKKAKIIYNVQEIYPDLLIEEGKLKSGIIISVLKWMERMVYNKSDAVTTIDEVFYKIIVNRFKQPSKLHIIPNFVDTNIYKPLNQNGIIIPSEFFPDTNSLKLMYAGNIGHAQDWNTLIEIAIQLKDSNVVFFVIGEGVMRNYLNEKIFEHQLTNIHLIPYQPRNLMPSLIAYADMQFIFMAPHTERHGFPSKVYTIMACAKPMLVCSGSDTPIVNFLKEKDCAFMVEEKNQTMKTETIVQILRTTKREELIRMGNNGFENINRNFSKEVVTDLYLHLIDSVLK